MAPKSHSAVRKHPLGERDEQRLIQAASSGDAEAFRALFEEKRERVYWTAYQILGDREEAREVTQKVFLKLWDKLDRYRSDYRFDTWLIRITKNAAIDAWRKRKARGIHDPLEDESGAPHHAPALQSSPSQETCQIHGEIQAIFDRLAERLTPKQRTAFTLRELRGLSTREVARVMRSTQSTVRNHVFQARKILQEGLREEFPEYLPPREETR